MSERRLARYLTHPVFIGALCAAIGFLAMVAVLTQ